MRWPPVFVLALPLLCNAATITVEPPQTIADAADRAGPGDTVVVRPGIYRESVRLKRAGTPEAPIRFVAEKPGTVIVTGADAISHFQRVEGEAPIYGVAWSHVFAIDHRDGKLIEHHPENAPLYGRAEQVIADDQQLLPCKDLADLRIAWKDREKRLQPPLKNLGGPFAGMFAVDTTYHVLYLWLADGSDPKAHAMQAATRPQLFGVNEFESQAGVHDVQVSGFIFRYAANFPQRAAVTLHGSHNQVDHCLIEKMAGTGVSVAGTLSHCLIRGNGFCGGAVEGDHFLVENCAWENNCWKPIDRNWEAGGAKVCDSRDGEFKNCVFRRNGGPGLWFDIDCRDINVHDCAFVENELSGLFIEISDVITAKTNYVAGNATEVVGEVPDQAWSCGGIQIAESSGCVIENNVCIGNRDGISIREIGPRAVKTRAQERNYRIRGDWIGDNTITKSVKYDLAFWWDNPFFGPHPSQKGPSESPAYDPTKQDLTINDDTFGPDAKFLYGVPWRPGSKKNLSLRDFVKLTEFEGDAKTSDQTISPPFSVEDLMNRNLPFALPSGPHR